MKSTLHIHSFHGGIHPPENKSQSTQQAIARLSLPSELILPLRQHSGAPAEPCVQVGERVLKGQLIAQAKGWRSANLHAPTSGTISAIELRPTPHSSGLSEQCIILACDGKEEWATTHPLIAEGQDLNTLDSAQLLQAVQQAGIVGLGGAGFPTAAKLASDKPIHTFILNAAECEPYITADDMLMRERAHEVVLGAALLMHICGAQQGLIGIEDNKPEAIAALNRALARLSLTSLQVVVIPTLYPSGSEKQLIKILTGLEVPKAGIPADLGLICQNVGTAAAAYRALYLGEPLISRITTVTGQAVQQAGNYDVLLGTPLSHVLAQVGYQPQVPERVIAGGPLMGFVLPSLAVPVTKTSNCFLAPTTSELPLNNTSMECIRCGQCVNVCPQELLPQQLYWYAKAGDLDKAQAYNIFDCIECGACSYVCPSKLPLVQYYRHAKGAIRLETEATVKAERAKERFESRNARLQRLIEEREAQRQARAQAKAQAEKEAAAAAQTATPDAEPISDLERKILAQQDRLLKSQQRWQAASEAGLETAEVLEQALLKQQDKLTKLEHELAAAQQTSKEA